MRKTPAGLRLHIGLFGRRNVGKSSLLNALTRQRVSIVSDVAGTTTDPVHKAMEIHGLGPVLFIDTAGLDDEGALGGLRVERTRRLFERTDVGLLVVQAGTWGAFENQVLAALRSWGASVLVVFNKTDLAQPADRELARLDGEGLPVFLTRADRGDGVDELRRAVVRAAPPSFLHAPSLLDDLVPRGGHAVFVVPVDIEAPRGRLILPQVQALRAVLDREAFCTVAKERDLSAVLDRLVSPPDLVVTDSQAFVDVGRDTPPAVPMTSFSILFARYKGDLETFVRGLGALERLREGDRILVAEGCSHHPISDDIATVKIPRWLRQYVGATLLFDYVQGHDFPERLGDYRLVIHCGACTLNRREVLSRMRTCREAGVPVTNYGLVIARSLGLLPRALGPFPRERAVFCRAAGAARVSTGP